jgi:hypothetical protein
VRESSEEGSGSGLLKNCPYLENRVHLDLTRLPHCPISSKCTAVNKTDPN